jgi:hypothetical protein
MALTLPLKPGKVVSLTTLQTRSVVDVPSVMVDSPAPHVDRARHVDAFVTLENRPAAHIVHCLSLDAVPADDTYCPEEQDDQATHARSVVLVTSVSTRWPAAHVVCGVHAVADAPSLSHVPLGHGTLGALPRAQKDPASQASHWAGSRAVAGATSSVPAGQSV